MTLEELMMGFVAGAALGGLFFGGLWLTVRRLPSASAPALLALGSYVGRLAGLAVGLYAVVRLGGAAALLGALVGLLVVRQLLVARLKEV
jgi:F1F0 ATPase subunit 2